LSLSGEWFECTIQYTKHFDSQLWVSKKAQKIEAGMSGSPIISDDGKGIGVVCLGGSGETKNPRLVRDLPARFLRPNA